MKNYINSDAIILHAAGKDARRYLNARLSNDIKILSAAQSCYAAALSPQGRTDAFFNILCLAADEFMLLCDGGNKEEVIKAFKRFIVADRIEVKDISSDYLQYVVFEENLQNLSALFDGAVLPDSPGRHSSLDDICVINTRRSAGVSLDLIVPQSKRSQIDQKLSGLQSGALNKEEFFLQSAKAGIPYFPEVLNGEIIFSASGLDYAISFKKGCYVGQEVIEKIDAYGKVPYLIKAAVAKGDLPQSAAVKIAGDLLPADKVLSRCHDKAEDKTYFFLELKNNDKILDSAILINDNEARIIC